MSIKLGQKYRDKVTGFEGTATSKTEFIFGCTRVGLETLVSGEVKSAVFDEPALEEVPEPPKVKEPKVKVGGSRPTPTRMSR